MEMNQKGRKKWVIKALCSTLKEGLYENRNKTQDSKRPGVLCIHGRLFRQNISWILVRKLRDSDILKNLGLLFAFPLSVLGLWILFVKLLGIANEILRATLIWLFIFSLFCSPIIPLFYYWRKEERSRK